jgi:hypothetical protein
MAPILQPVDVAYPLTLALPPLTLLAKLPVRTSRPRLSVPHLPKTVVAHVHSDDCLEPTVYTAVPRKFLSIVGQHPINYKSNRLHVNIFRCCFYSFEVYSIDSSEMIGKSPKSPTSTGYFSNPTGSSATNCQFSPDSGTHYTSRSCCGILFGSSKTL